jgi:pSer/pThr/pTyr-binding forkhead associated (FHA) protein
MADAPVLVCTGGALKGRAIRVPEGGLDIGRAEDNHIVVKDDGVSRYHARLLYDAGSLWLQDAGSRNGVFVNGARVTDHRALKVGDVIRLSDHTFAVRWEAEVDPANPPLDDETEEAATTEEGPPPPERKPWYWPF